MDWFKVSNKYLFHSGFTSGEFMSYCKLMGLTASIEKFPTKEKMLTVITEKKLKCVEKRLQSEGVSIEYVLQKVLEDVEKVKGKREYWKQEKAQQRNKTKNVRMEVNTESIPKIRLDKIREDKIIVNTYTDKEIKTVDNSKISEFIKAWGELYQSETKHPYRTVSKDLLIITDLIQEYGYDIVKEKSKILYDLCTSKKAWFTKDGMSDFTIQKLKSVWNNITKEAGNDGKQFNTNEAEDWLAKRSKERAEREALNKGNTENITIQEY